METGAPLAVPRRSRWACAVGLASPIVVWAVWAAMTAAIVSYVNRFPRYVPCFDDFVLVPLITGHTQVNLAWAWAQHNEHRPFVSRLILAGLCRFVVNDFRVGKYFNVALLSGAAAAMLLLARKLRGRTTVSDAVLPLSFLTIGQTETLAITFAMNLVLTAVVCCALIATVTLASERRDWVTAVAFGLLLALLPLTSGIVLLPALVLWLAGYVACDWWSGRPLGRAARAVGVIALMVCSALGALYVSGYVSPSYHPPPPSLWAIVETALRYVSLAVAPNGPRHWRLAGLVVVLLIVGTMARLLFVALRSPAERVRATGLIAILMAMCTAAAAVGYSRSGLGLGMGLATRYVTLTAPLLAALYFAWLACGRPIARRAVHVLLFLLICLSFRDTTARGLRSGKKFWDAERRVERNLKAHMPAAELVRLTCLNLQTDPRAVLENFRLLKQAGVGAFKELNDDRVAVSPADESGVRR